MCLKRRLFRPERSKRIFPKNAGEGGLWVWKTPGEVPPETLISRARMLGARVVYLNAYPLGKEALDWLETVIVLAAVENLQIELLYGAPGWIKESARPFLRAAIIDPLVRLERQLKLGGISQPLRLHLDVEPHIEGAMDDARLAATLDLLAWLRGHFDMARVSLDVPVWYSDLRLNGRPFSEALL